MIYLDTSAAVPLFVPEVATERVLAWYASSADALVSADWILPEFASALSLKERRGEITAEQSQLVWSEFLAFSDNGLRLVPINRKLFRDAAARVLDAASGLRAGDSLHLATAIEIGATGFATTDATLAANARKMGLPTIPF